jgi:hypothetical protein
MVILKMTEILIIDVNFEKFFTGNIIDKPLKKKRKAIITSRAMRYLLMSENLFSLFFLITMTADKKPRVHAILKATMLILYKVDEDNRLQQGMENILKDNKIKNNFYALFAIIGK